MWLEELTISNSQIDFKVFKLLTAYNYVVFPEQGNTERYTYESTIVDL